MSKEKKPKAARKSRKKVTPNDVDPVMTGSANPEATTDGAAATTAVASPKPKRARRTSSRGSRVKTVEPEIAVESSLPEPEVDHGMEISDEPEIGKATADAPAPRGRMAETRSANVVPEPRIELTTPNAIVEKKNDKIVIRFPPAGVPTLPMTPSSTAYAAPSARLVEAPAPAERAPAAHPGRESPPLHGGGGKAREGAGVAQKEQRNERPVRQERSEGRERAARIEEHPRDQDAFGGLTEEEFRKLSPSQKRRLRRKRRLKSRETGAPGTELRDEAAPTVRGPERIAKPAARETEAETPEFDIDDGSMGSSQIDTEWGEELSGVEELEAAGSEGEIETEEEEESRESRRGRRGRGRRGRGRRRGRGGDGERSEAADRVFGDENSEVIEIGEDLVTTMARERAAEEPAESDEDDLGHVVAPGGPRREMIINIIPRDECRIAVLNEGKLEEIYIERSSSENHVGNIYKGVVTNVEPSIQAAFIDFGMGKNGFLHISDLHPKYFPAGGRDTENVGRKMPRRHRPPIQRCLRRNQELLVQITKEGIGTKGPTLTTYLSIPGRFLVMMPGMSKVGVSRKIEDEDVRRELRNVLSGLQLPGGMGFIARTAAVGRTTREVQSDLNYLSRLWRAVERRIQDEPAPAELYRESDLVIRTIRDVFSSDIHRIVVDDREVAERARQFLSIFSPRSRDAVVDYTESGPIFHHYGVEPELERLHSKHVSLPSGGSLIIEQTEALVSIDVNSGRYRTADDAETTAFKINLEATDEIARQLRLRDLGGLIICDFIDMRDENHRREVERRLIRNLKYHKERAKILRMSQFGIVEMTRQRQRASFTRSVHQPCPHCRGTSMVKTAESVAIEVMRTIQLAVTREAIHTIEVSVAPDVAHMLLNRKRAVLSDLEARHRKTIYIKPDPHFTQDQVQIQCTDNRGRMIPYQ